MNTMVKQSTYWSYYSSIALNPQPSKPDFNRHTTVPSTAISGGPLEGVQITVRAIAAFLHGTIPHLFTYAAGRNVPSERWPGLCRVESLVLTVTPIQTTARSRPLSSILPCSSGCRNQQSYPVIQPVGFLRRLYVVPHCSLIVQYHEP